MGLSKGNRIVINDRRPNGKDTAFAINIDRDYGLGDIEI